jgi:CARDB
MKKDPGNTFKTAQTVFISNKAQVLSDFVSSKDKFDVYRIKLSKSSNFKSFLTGLKAKADVTLYNTFGKPIKRSTASKNGKSLNAQLNPGLYYIAVAQISGATSYRLSLAANPTVGQVIKPPPPPPPPTTVDLVGDRLSIFPSGFIGRSNFSNARNFDVNYSIKNLGNSEVKEVFVSFYLSSNNYISTTDRLLSTYYVNDLSAFSTTPTFVANLNLPAASDSWWLSNPGEGSSIGMIRTYYVGMVIDPGANVVETDEANNSNMGTWIDYASITISNPAG